MRNRIDWRCSSHVSAAVSGLISCPRGLPCRSGVGLVARLLGDVRTQRRRRERIDLCNFGLEWCISQLIQ